MKESFYFPHDYDAAIDPKIQALIGKFGGAGYGIFWRVIEMLHSNSEHKLPLKPYIYSAIAKQMLTSDEQMLEVVMYCIEFCELFQSDREYFWSDRVNKNFEKRNEISEKRSIAGRKGFEAKYKNQAIAQQILANGSKRKEKKRKEIKENTPANPISNLNENFELFWKTYPKKTSSKKEAKDYWIKIEHTLPPVEIITAGINKQIEWRKNAHGEFRPEWKDAVRWLKCRMWEGEFGNINVVTTDYDKRIEFLKKQYEERKGEKDETSGISTAERDTVQNTIESNSF